MCLFFAFRLTCHDAPALSSAVPVHTTVDTCHNLDLCGVRQKIIYVQAFKARDTAPYTGRGGEVDLRWTHTTAAGKLQRAGERTEDRSDEHWCAPPAKLRTIHSDESPTQRCGK